MHDDCRVEEAVALVGHEQDGTVGYVPAHPLDSMEEADQQRGEPPDQIGDQCLLVGPEGRHFALVPQRDEKIRVTIAKKRPAESPHMRMPVSPSTGPSMRHGFCNTTSP